MIRLTFSVMRLSDSDQPLGVAVESLSMPLLLIPKLDQLGLREAHLIHRALPAALTPPSKILVDTLAFQPIESGHRDHIPRDPIHRNDDTARSARHD